MSGILVAEDEQPIAAFLERGLCRNGVATSVVRHGPATLRAASYGQHDLPILDIGRPGMDGFALLGRLREAYVSVPVGHLDRPRRRHRHGRRPLRRGRSLHRQTLCLLPSCWPGCGRGAR